MGDQAMKSQMDITGEQAEGAETLFAGLGLALVVKSPSLLGLSLLEWIDGS